MSTVCTVLDVARSNIAERMAGRLHQRLGRPPQPDAELVAAIKAVIADMPTCASHRHDGGTYADGRGDVGGVRLTAPPAARAS